MPHPFLQLTQPVNSETPFSANPYDISLEERAALRHLEQMVAAQDNTRMVMHKHPEQMKLCAAPNHQIEQASTYPTFENQSRYSNRVNDLVNKKDEDSFNWGIPVGLVGTMSSLYVEYAGNKVRVAFKTGNTPISWYRLNPNQQVWRTTRILGESVKYVKYAKSVGIIGTSISIGMASYDIVKGEGTTIDYLDVGVGSASIAAAMFLASNPIGWAIGIGATVYFAGRLVYDVYEEIND